MRFTERRGQTAVKLSLLAYVAYALAFGYDFAIFAPVRRLAHGTLARYLPGTKWNMFADPPTSNYEVRARVERADGSEVRWTLASLQGGPFSNRMDRMRMCRWVKALPDTARGPHSQDAARFLAWLAVGSEPVRAVHVSVAESPIPRPTSESLPSRDASLSWQTESALWSETLSRGSR